MSDKQTKKIKKHGLGWRPDTPDHRDLLFAKLMKIPEKLPASVDLRKYCSKVEDQGDLGSCTANALVGNLEFLEIKDKVHFEDLSRLFIYYNERVIENTVFSDSGAELRDGIKSLVKWGVSSEKCWPYDISKFADKPSNTCYTEGSKHQVVSYYRIITLAEMKACLAAEYPFVYGFAVYESFETEEVASTGIVPMPGTDEQLLGGHAIAAVGYDVNKKIFSGSQGSILFRNSWGQNWGMNGYGWMPIEYVTNRNLSDDFWSIRRAENL